MGLKKLFRAMRDCRKYRGDYKTEWRFYAFADTNDYVFCLLPTIFWQPWPYRQTGIAVIEIQFLNLHVCLGKWVNRNSIIKEGP